MEIMRSLSSEKNKNLPERVPYHDFQIFLNGFNDDIYIEERHVDDDVIAKGVLIFWTFSRSTISF
jgi:hypothetical protein